MKNKEDILKEKERINQKIFFCKKYSGYLIRIAIGSFLSTLLFVYMMDVVNIDLSSLKISTFSLLFLASLPTLIPLVVSYLFYKQVPELKTILKELEIKLDNRN